MPDPSPYVRVIAVTDQGPNHRGPLARVDTITGNQDDATRRVTEIAELAARNGHPLPSLAATQTVWVVPLPAEVLNLIRGLADPDPCQYDHQGTCQAHGQGSDPHCWHATAQALLTVARQEGLLPDD